MGRGEKLRLRSDGALAGVSLLGERLSRRSSLIHIDVSSRVLFPVRGRLRRRDLLPGLDAKVY